jgi:hypothetical protein
VELLEQIRTLDFCDEGDLDTHLREAIRRGLVRRFGAPNIAVVPKKPASPRPKTARPAGISEATWNDVLAMRKPKRPKPAQMAA